MGARRWEFPYGNSHLASFVRFTAKTGTRAFRRSLTVSRFTSSAYRQTPLQWPAYAAAPCPSPTLANTYGVRQPNCRLASPIKRWISFYLPLYFAASRIASIMLTALALFCHAMSNAVPWSTDVRKIGIPHVTAIVRSKSSVFVAICP